MDKKIALLALLWVLWCTFHSGMISITVTEFLKRRMGHGWRFYRLFYNLFAILSLIPLIIYSNSFTGPTLFNWQGPLSVLRVLLLTLAILLFYAGAKKYDMLNLLGLKQIRKGSTTALLTTANKLETTGVLGITRHPWYLAAYPVHLGMGEGTGPGHTCFEHRFEYLSGYRDTSGRAKTSSGIRRRIPAISKRGFYAFPI